MENNEITRIERRASVQTLNAILEEYQRGERSMPTYAELRALFGAPPKATGEAAAMLAKR
jgi:hypothetical protein